MLVEPMMTQTIGPVANAAAERAVSMLQLVVFGFGGLVVVLALWASARRQRRGRRRVRGQTTLTDAWAEAGRRQATPDERSGWWGRRGGDVDGNDGGDDGGGGDGGGD